MDPGAVYAGCILCDGDAVLERKGDGIMLGHLGFSYWGFLDLLMLFIPNFFWTKRKPSGYTAAGENKLLAVLERVGQVLVTCCALIFTDWNPGPLTPWSLWLAASILLMLLYEFYWWRYFRSGRGLKDMYGPLWGIPVPGASLPVAAFLLLGIYGKVTWMIASVVILGIGHIGIHLQHWKEVT